MERLDQDVIVLECEELGFDEILERIENIVRPVAQLVAGDENFSQVSHAALTRIITLSQNCDSEIVANAIAEKLLKVAITMADDEVEPCYKVGCNQFIGFLNHISHQINVSNACRRDLSCNITEH